MDKWEVLSIVDAKTRVVAPRDADSQWNYVRVNMEMLIRYAKGSSKKKITSKKRNQVFFTVELVVKTADKIKLDVEVSKKKIRKHKWEELVKQGNIRFWPNTKVNKTQNQEERPPVDKDAEEKGNYRNHHITKTTRRIYYICNTTGPSTPVGNIQVTETGIKKEKKKEN